MAANNALPGEVRSVVDEMAGLPEYVLSWSIHGNQQQREVHLLWKQKPGLDGNDGSPVAYPSQSGFFKSCTKETKLSSELVQEPELVCADADQRLLDRSADQKRPKFGNRSAEDAESRSKYIKESSHDSESRSKYTEESSQGAESGPKYTRESSQDAEIYPKDRKEPAERDMDEAVVTFSSNAVYNDLRRQRLRSSVAHGADEYGNVRTLMMNQVLQRIEQRRRGLWVDQQVESGKDQENVEPTNRVGKVRESGG